MVLQVTWSNSSVRNFFTDDQIIGQLDNWIIENFSKLIQGAEMVRTGRKRGEMKFQAEICQGGFWRADFRSTKMEHKRRFLKMDILGSDISKKGRQVQSSECKWFSRSQGATLPLGTFFRCFPRAQTWVELARKRRNEVFGPKFQKWAQKI